MSPTYLAKLLREAAHFIKRNRRAGPRPQARTIELLSKLEAAAKYILEEEDQEIKAKFGISLPQKKVEATVMKTQMIKHPLLNTMIEIPLTKPRKGK